MAADEPIREVPAFFSYARADDDDYEIVSEFYRLFKEVAGDPPSKIDRVPVAEVSIPYGLDIENAGFDQNVRLVLKVKGHDIAYTHVWQRDALRSIACDPRVSLQATRSTDVEEYVDRLKVQRRWDPAMRPRRPSGRGFAGSNGRPRFMSARLGCDPGGRPAKKRRSELGRLGRFVVTLLGTFLPLGIAHPAPFAEANAERPVIERVEIIRERLLQGYRQNLLHPEWPRLAQWGNLPNWGN